MLSWARGGQEVLPDLVNEVLDFVAEVPGIAIALEGLDEEELFSENQQPDDEDA